MKNCFLSASLSPSSGADVISGVPTVVKTNILIRSMGPVSELDMVCMARHVPDLIDSDLALKASFHLHSPGLLNGLLFPTVLAR